MPLSPSFFIMMVEIPSGPIAFEGFSLLIVYLKSSAPFLLLSIGIELNDMMLLLLVFWSPEIDLIVFQKLLDPEITEVRQ